MNTNCVLDVPNTIKVQQLLQGSRSIERVTANIEQLLKLFDVSVEKFFEAFNKAPFRAKGAKFVFVQCGCGKVEGEHLVARRCAEWRGASCYSFNFDGEAPVLLQSDEQDCVMLTHIFLTMMNVLANGCLKKEVREHMFANRLRAYWPALERSSKFEVSSKRVAQQLETLNEQNKKIRLLDTEPRDYAAIVRTEMERFHAIKNEACKLLSQSHPVPLFFEEDIAHINAKTTALFLERGQCEAAKYTENEFSDAKVELALVHFKEAVARARDNCVAFIKQVEAEEESRLAEERRREEERELAEERRREEERLRVEEKQREERELAEERLRVEEKQREEKELEEELVVAAARAEQAGSCTLEQENEELLMLAARLAVELDSRAPFLCEADDYSNRELGAMHARSRTTAACVHDLLEARRAPIAEELHWNGPTIRVKLPNMPKLLAAIKQVRRQ